MTMATLLPFSTADHTWSTPWQPIERSINGRATLEIWWRALSATTTTLSWTLSVKKHIISSSVTTFSHMGNRCYGICPQITTSTILTHALGPVREDQATGNGSRQRIWINRAFLPPFGQGILPKNHLSTSTTIGSNTTDHWLCPRSRKSLLSRCTRTCVIHLSSQHKKEGTT